MSGMPISKVKSEIFKIVLTPRYIISVFNFPPMEKDVVISYITDTMKVVIGCEGQI